MSSSTNTLKGKQQQWSWVLCPDSIDCPKGTLEKKSSRGKLKLTSTLKRNQAETKRKIQHSLVYSCDTWCPPKIVQDFKNLCSWIGKGLSTGDETEKERTTRSLSWNTTEVLDIGTACAGGGSMQTPSKKLSNPDQPPEGTEEVLKTFLGRSRAGSRGWQEKNNFYPAI